MNLGMWQVQVAFAVGVACGFVIDKGIEFIVRNIGALRSSMNTAERKSLLPRWAVVLLVITCIAQFALAVGQTYVYLRYKNFEQCQANHDSTTIKTDDALFEWVKDIPPLLQADPSIEDVNAFKKSLDKYITYYTELQNIQCGNPTEGVVP